MTVRLKHPAVIAVASLMSMIMLFCLCLMNAASFADAQEARVWRTHDPIIRQALVDNYRRDVERLPNSMFYALVHKPTPGFLKRFDHQGPTPK